MMEPMGTILALISFYYAFLAWVVFTMWDRIRVPWEGLGLTIGSLGCFIWSSYYWPVATRIWERLL